MSRTALLIGALLCSACRGRFDALSDAGRERVDATGEPNAAKLLTKHVFGAPGTSFTISFTGGDPANLQLVFIDAAHVIVHASPVATDGSVTLPATAGVYRIELRDATTGGLSHGQATVTAPVTSFVGYQQMDLDSQGGFAPNWPTLSTVATDINGDGSSDLVRSSGLAGPTGLAGAGVFVQLWSPVSSQLLPPVLVPMPDSRFCGVVMFDADHDGAPDAVTVAERPATFELQVCLLRNTGNGNFAAPDCTLEQYVAMDYFSCRGGIASADFNRDGWVDLAIAGGRMVDDLTATELELRLLRNTGQASFVTETSWRAPATFPFRALAIGDVNDDGRLDVLANGGAPARLHVFVATDDFVLAEPTLLTSAQGDFAYDAIVPAYVDDNATLDVFTVHPDGPSSIFYSDGQTLIPSEIPTFAEQHGSRFHVLDLDVDGLVDVIMPYKNRFLAMNRVGAMHKTASDLTADIAPAPSNTIYGVSPQPDWTLGQAIFQDWDRDGRLDLMFIIAFTTPKQLEILRGN